MNSIKENDIYPVMGEVDTENLLTQETQDFLRMYECSYERGKSISGKHYILIGKYSVAHEKTRVSITLKVKTTTEYDTQIAYLPISRYYYSFLRRKEILLRSLNIIAGLIIIIGILSGFAWLFGSYWIPKIIGLESDSIIASSIFAFIWLMVATSIKNRWERNASKKVIQLSFDGEKYGIPDYNHRIVEFLVETDNIQEVVLKDLVLEKELRNIKIS